MILSVYNPIDTMIGLKIFVFFLGTTFVSCRVLRSGPFGINGIKYGKPSFSTFPRNNPFVSEMQPFIEQGTNLFYKPQLMMPSMQFLPFDNKNERNLIRTPKFPYTVQDPKIFMSRPIETPGESIIEYVVPATPERAQEHIRCDQIKVNDPSTLIQTSTVPELQPLPELQQVVLPEAPEISNVHVQEPAQPEVIEIIQAPLEIPEAPVLPEFQIPKIPVSEGIFTGPIDILSKPIIEASAPEIPEAPVLPNFVMPELPSLETLTSPELFSPTPEEPSQSAPCITQEIQDIVIPEAPEISNVNVQESFLPEVIEIIQAPLEIPEAPVLPEFQIPEIPVSEGIFTRPIEFISKPIIEASAPEIPEAPVLPNFVMPELPSLETLTSPEMFPPTPEEPSQSVPCITQEFQDIVLPEAPEISNVNIQDLFQPEFIEIIQAPLEISEAPVLPEFQMPAIPAIEDFATETIEVISEPQESLEHVEQIEIPEAPMLPALSLLGSPEPVILEITKETTPPEIQEPEVKPMEIIKVPENLELPIMQTPIIQEPTFIGIHSEQPCEHTENIKPTEVIAESRPILNHPLHLPQYLPYPAFFAQNIIIERVVPNMIFNSGKIPVNAYPYLRNQPVPIFEESFSDV